MEFVVSSRYLSIWHIDMSMIVSLFNILSLLKWIHWLIRCHGPLIFDNYTPINPKNFIGKKYKWYKSQKAQHPSFLSSQMFTLENCASTPQFRISNFGLSLDFLLVIIIVLDNLLSNTQSWVETNMAGKFIRKLAERRT